MPKFYAVRKGHRPGIYNSWDEAGPQTQRFPGSRHKSFKTLRDAQAFIDASDDDNPAARVVDDPLARVVDLCSDSEGVVVDLCSDSGDEAQPDPADAFWADLDADMLDAIDPPIEPTPTERPPVDILISDMVCEVAPYAPVKREKENRAASVPSTEKTRAVPAQRAALVPAYANGVLFRAPDVDPVKRVMDRHCARAAVADQARAAAPYVPVPRVRADRIHHSIAEFFADYPGFDYVPWNGAWSEWERLCWYLGVDPDNRDVWAVRELTRQLNGAMVRQFNTRFGCDAEKLAAWQALCRYVDVPVPGTLRECQEAIRHTHVNLVDLTELREGEVVERFESEAALSEYTLATRRFFPREHADAGGLLKKLFRHIDNPRPE